MRKLLIIAYVLFVSVFAFLPKSVETGVFLLFVLGSAGMVIVNIKKFKTLYISDEDTRKLVWLFNLFLWTAAVYFLLSFANIPHHWGIKGLQYGRSYIPRHFIIIAELFLPIYLGFALYITRFFDRIKTAPLLIFFFLVFFFVKELCLVAHLLVSLALISWKFDKKILFYLAFFAINRDSSSAVLGCIALTILVCFEKPITRYFRKNTLRKIIVVFFFSIICILVLSNVLALAIQKDPNSLWRLRVWANEIKSLSQTYFTGVGFGSAYVTDDIFLQVSNYSMYVDEFGGGTGVFLVANHSSILNMFYRMGLLGGLLFLAMIIQIILIVFKTYQKADYKRRSLLWRLFSIFVFEVVIICLNPGLEMMQFALGFLLSLSSLFSVILEVHNPQQVKHKPL